jgi:hypothetical protein
MMNFSQFGRFSGFLRAIKTTTSKIGKIQPIIGGSLAQPFTERFGILPQNTQERDSPVIEKVVKFLMVGNSQRLG